MTPTPTDPYLRALASQLTDSGFPVSVHPPDGQWPIEWLESLIPGCFGGQDVGLRWLSLDDQSNAPAEDDDDEPVPALALIRIDALIPLAIDDSQLPLTLTTIETINDVLPFGAIGLRPQAGCWAWHYTLASPAASFNGLLALHIVDTLRFYLEALSPVVIAAFGRRDRPESIRDAIRSALAEIADGAEASASDVQA